jgi:hypothetical protein
MTQAATNISSEDQGGAINPSGARQIVKPAKKEFRRINKVYVALEKAGLTDAILTIPPRTKIPAIYNPNGSHGPHYKWTTNVLTLQQVKRANLANAGAGIKGKFIGGLDYDGESVELAALIHGLAETYLGLSPIRGRPNSQRFLRPYRYKSDPIKRWSIKLRDKDGAEHTVEFIGDKCFWVAAGTHPSGFDYTYEGGIDLWKFGVGNLSQIDQADCDAFQAEIVREAIALGFELVSNKKSRSSSTRLSIDDPRHWAPTPELAIRALKARPNTAENNPRREDLVRYIAAVKAALGPNREDYWPDVLEWALAYEGNKEDDVRKIWDSIRETEIGYSFLAGSARAHGFIDAEYEFDDVPPDAILENAINRMLTQYVYVRNLGQYCDLEDGSFLSGKDFNAANVDVKPFGSSGQQSAEAVFQNTPGARKVATATSRPGAPVITREVNERGILVDAVNLWRPSILKPNLNATTADVAPWLNLIEILLGSEGTPEREHFLDWCAFVLQQPGEKIGHAMVLIGGQGVGKDTALKPIFEAVGIHNVASIDTATLQGQFNFFLKCQLIYVQEAMTYGRRDLYNTAKPYISAQATRLAVNEKNIRQYSVPNIQNWLITSNYENALSLEYDDRRFWVYRVLIDEPPSSGYFAGLHSWFKAGGTEKVFGWLMQRDLSKFDPMAKPPMTAAKRVMLEASHPRPVRLLLEQLTDGGPLAHRTVLTAVDLRLAAAKNDYNASRQEIHDDHATAALRAAGFKSAHRVRLKVGMRTLWARNVDRTMKPDAMRDVYEKESGAR